VCNDVRSADNRNECPRAIQIDWDGTTFPEGLRQLRPGRYLVSDPHGDDDEMTEEEAAGVMRAIDEIEAGQGIPLEVAIREIRARVGP
jgi:hypothetical protein